MIQGVSTPGDISTDAGVTLTNAGLALLTLVLLVVSAELFNKTVEENEDWFKRVFGVVFGPLERVSSTIRGWAGDQSALRVMAPLLGLIAAGALIYAFAEPGFGFNERSIVAVVSVLVALFVLTYFYNGGQILVSNGFGVRSAMRLFPIGIAFALISVALTRLDDFQPLVIYGFIASAVVVGGVERTREQEGRVIFYPALALLGLCLLAWLLLDPFRDLARDNDGVLTALPEAVAVGLLVGGLEGMFFQMVPIRYMDGHKLWVWNKLAWFIAAGATAFLVWQILLNRERSSVNAIQEGTPEVAVIAMAVCLVLSVSLYLFFRFKNAAAQPA